MTLEEVKFKSSFLGRISSEWVLHQYADERVNYAPSPLRYLGQILSYNKLEIDLNDPGAMFLTVTDDVQY